MGIVMNVNSDHVVAIISPDTLDELIELLELRWPDRRIPAAEFHKLVEGMPEINWRVWLSQTGLGRHWYNTREVAELLWRAYESTDNPDE